MCSIYHCMKINILSLPSYSHDRAFAVTASVLLDVLTSALRGLDNIRQFKRHEKASF